MNSATLQVPVIYFSDKTLKPGTSKWSEVRSDVRKSLEEFGFFEASTDILSMELQESIGKVLEEVFALPVESKKRNVCPKPYLGYLTHNGLSESLGINDPNVLEQAQEFTQQLWPGEGNEKISKTIQLFAEKLAEIDVMVRKMLMESFGLEKYIEEHLNSTNYRIRLMKYIAPSDTTNDDHDANVDVKVLNVDHANGDDDVNANSDAIAVAIGGINLDANVNGEANGNGHEANGNVDVDAKTGAKEKETSDDDDDVEKKLGFPCHTDKNLITVIFQHEIEGLEVNTKDGKWIRLKPTPNTFVVVAGDCLCALTNGRISPAYHRVRVTEKKKTRYSAALFTQPKPGLLVDSPKELVDENHPRVFKPFDYADLMAFYHTEANRKYLSTLKYFAVAGA